MLSKVCCFSLETFAKIIGWLGVVFSSILALIIIIVLANAETLIKSVVEESTDQSYNEYHAVLVLVCSFLLVIVLVSLVISGLLILGTVQKRHLMLLPWLITSGLGILLNGFSILAELVELFSYPSAESFFIFIFSILTSALQVYIVYGIYSLYKKIQASHDRGLPMLNQQQYVVVPSQQGNTVPMYPKL